MKGMLASCFTCLGHSKSCCIIALLCTPLLAGIVVAQSSTPSPGAVFAATNGLDQNKILMYTRHENGRLTFVGAFRTGGRGEGGINDPLQSQSSLFLSPDHLYLFAVNAGSSSISLFRIRESGLELLSVTHSEGGNPVSVAMHDDLVYVINFGGTYHTAGFRLRSWGLEPIQNSKQPLSGLNTEPSTIAFSPDGSKLVLTERQTNKIDVFTVNGDGSISHPVFNHSAGIEPFGLQFTPSGVLLVTETNGGPPKLGSTSSYRIDDDNSLDVVSARATSAGGATCWIANNGVHAWVSNTTSSSIGAYTIEKNGGLTPLGVVATQPATEPTIFPPVHPPTSFPIDLALSEDSRYLYVVFSALGKIIGYKTGQNGSLTEIGSVSPYPPQTGVQGIAAY
jgi:6-phosphogluconolactonase